MFEKRSEVVFTRFYICSSLKYQITKTVRVTVIFDNLQIYHSDIRKEHIYATPAAGGIIYSLNIFCVFLARPYGLTIANIFIPSSLGGQKLLVKWRKVFILKFYTVGSLNRSQFWRVSLKKSENWPTSDQNYHILKVASVKTKVGLKN